MTDDLGHTPASGASPGSAVPPARMKRSRAGTSTITESDATRPCKIASSAIHDTPLKTSPPKRSSRRPVASAIGTSSRFTLFSKLPAEVRLMIWHCAIVPRIVCFKPDKIPAIAHACKDSRDAAKYFFEIRDDATGIFMNPKLDILLWDESSFAPEQRYHISAYHTLYCGCIKDKLTERVERIALTVNELYASWSAECFHCFLTNKFIKCFPNVKELIVILRPGPLGSGYEDLYEVNDINTASTAALINDTKAIFDAVQGTDAWKTVKLTLMRMEKWER